MKMPDKLDSKLLAPCGINCISCERYQNPCAGCLIGDDGKTKSQFEMQNKILLLIQRILAIAEGAVNFHAPQMKKNTAKNTSKDMI